MLFILIHIVKRSKIKNHTKSAVFILKKIIIKLIHKKIKINTETLIAQPKQTNKRKPCTLWSKKLLFICYGSAVQKWPSNEEMAVVFLMWP